MEQKIITPITKGVLLGLILIVVSLVIYFMKIEDSSIQWIPNGLLVIGVLISVTQYGKQVAHNATFGDYFSHGFKVAALVTIIMIVYLLVFINVFPEFKDKALEQARKQMEAKKSLSPEKIDQALDITRKFFSLFAVLGILIWDMILGAIGALLGALITKKEPVTFHEEHYNQTTA